LTVTIRHLQGTREPLDIVIAAHLTDNWDSSNITDTVTPTIEALTYIPSYNVEEDYATNPNIIKVSVLRRFRVEDDEHEPLGDDSHNWQTELQIDVWAETPILLQEFEDEINRILWEIRPNENTRLKKSDGVQATLSAGSQDSEIESFEKTEVDFEFLGTDDDSAARVSSTATLTVNWFKLKT
jgi:hypothetical protein